MDETHKMTEEHAIDFFAEVVPQRYWRPVMSHLGGDLTSVIGLGWHEGERRILGILAELTDRDVCGRCGGAGRYGHHGVCYECGGRRLI